MQHISELCKSSPYIGIALQKKYRKVEKATIVLYTNILFKVIYTAFMLQKLRYHQEDSLSKNIEEIESIEDTMTYVSENVIFKKIDPTTFELKGDCFITALLINHIEPIDFGLKDLNGIQHVFDAVQHCMKLELIHQCSFQNKNLELMFQVFFTASAEYTTIYKIIKGIKSRLYQFTVNSPNFYDVYFTKKYTQMLYKKTEVNLSDIPCMAIYLIQRFMKTLEPVLVDRFRLENFIDENYDPNFYSEKGCLVPVHNYRSFLPFKNIGESDVRNVLQNNFHKLNKLLILIMYFTGGEPFRISEAVGLSFNDKNRNIYFRGGKMIVTFTYNKTDNIRNDIKLISRVYPTIVAKLVYFYINYIRLYEVRALVGLIDNDTANQEKLQNLVDINARYLFIDFSTSFVVPDDIYSLMKTLSAKCLGKLLGVRDWRQIMVQFTKKNISSTTKLSSNLIYRFLESQVGHSSVVALNSYEKTSTREFENSLVEAQQQMSERWIEIINLPTELSAINDFVPNVQLQESVLY